MADITGIGSVLDFGGKLIERLWPDPKQKAEAQQKLAELHESGNLAALAAETGLAQAQLDINKVEAASPKMFIAGWRPAVGWVGVISLALVYWPRAIVLCVVWCIQAYGVLKGGGAIPPYPDLGLTDILGLLASLLGMGGLRTAEKIKNAEGNR